MPDLRFSTLTPNDLLAIQLQPSQEVLFGMEATISREDAEIMAAAPIAWAARKGSQLLACFGIVEHFPGTQGLAWALLAEGIGAAHLELTRFMRSQIENCGLARLELLARGPDMEAEIAAHPGTLDSGQIVALAMLKATKPMRWAKLLGMQPAHLLRCYGAAAEGYMLFERIAPAPAMAEAA